jgi:hypothetical protein
MWCVEGSTYQQPGTWLLTEKVNQIGPLQENYNYCFDWELIIRYLSSYPNVAHSNKILVHFRLQELSKTVSKCCCFEVETNKILQQFLINPKYKHIHGYIDQRISWKAWHEYIAGIINSNDNRFEKTIKIILRILIDPSIRLNRFTIGALRHIIFDKIQEPS